MLKRIFMMIKLNIMGSIICILTIVAVPQLLYAQASAEISGETESNEMFRRENYPPKLTRCLEPQGWVRDSKGPVISLGNPGSFDDMHIFAPCVCFENDTYYMWYCGSRGEVDDRIFRLGYAASKDGINFEKADFAPVYEFGDGKSSVLTPTLLRNPDGSLHRENGELRMWFTASDLTQYPAPHTLHEAVSADGIHWSSPSPVQLDNVYSPTVIKENNTYRMWYTDVTSDPWVIRHASSKDGKSWDITEKPCLVIDQDWEIGRLFYATVLKADGVYLIWYGSYWIERAVRTAIGFAVSEDGLTWVKNPYNPIYRPDTSRPWESHYTTSQSVIRMADGSFRIWYATRKELPHVNKYYAIGTAFWRGPSR